MNIKRIGNPVNPVNPACPDLALAKAGQKKHLSTVPVLTVPYN